MFKLFFVYPVVIFIVFWLASDVKFGASIYTFKDNYLSLEFPKKQFRPDDHPQPYYSFYWNAISTEMRLEKIKDAVVDK